MGQIFFAGEKSNEGTPLQGDVVADGAPQRGIACFQRVEHLAQRRVTAHLDDHVAELAVTARLLFVPPALHRGLPSPYLTLIFTLDDPLVIAIGEDDYEMEAGWP